MGQLIVPFSVKYLTRAIEIFKESSDLFMRSNYAAGFEGGELQTRGAIDTFASNVK